MRRVAATMSAHRDVLRAFMHLGALDEVISHRGSLESVEVSRLFKEALGRTPRSSGMPILRIALDVAFRITYSTLARQVMYGPVFESEIELGWDAADRRARATLARQLSALLSPSWCDAAHP